jgi:Flp pilus assembly protein CpaB
VATDVKPRSNRLLMVLGIVIASLAFFVFLLFGRGGAGSSQGARTIDTVVAAVDIPAGQLISDQIVRVEKFAPEQAPAGAVATIKAATGQYAAVALTKNTALTTGTLVSSQSKLPAAKKPFLDIPAGQVAVSIPAGGELLSVGGFIQPEDRVDILWAPTPSAWQVAFQNLKVAHVGPVGGANAQGIATSFVVFVSVDDAQALSLLFANGSYKYVLRSQADAAKNDTVTSGGTTLPALNSRFHVPTP